MSFILEVSKTGKDTILFNNHKYRESYSVKSGEIVWRCLGKICKASIRTNKEKNAIYFSNECHSGQHPVTMRALTPTTSNRATIPQPAGSSPLTTTPESTPSRNSFTDTYLGEKQLNDVHTDLHAENIALKKEIAELRQERRMILDHSIESDQRLLQYTEAVFLPPPSPTELSPAMHSPISKATQTIQDSNSTNDCAVQCNLTPNICDNQLCMTNRELVESLKTTVEVLEAEIVFLKTEMTKLGPSLIEAEDSFSSWKIQSKQKLLSTNNKFSVLDSEQQPFQMSRAKKAINSSHKSAKSKKKNNKPKIDKTRVVSTNIISNLKLKPNPFMVHFDNVVIEGDSHARDLSGILQQNIGRSTTVTGICKPSAKLLNVTSGAPPPPGTRSCCIILAGSNDVAAGEARNIYSLMEQQIKTRLSSAAVILSTIPFRHDLPKWHLMNQQIVDCNSYLKELGKRLHVEVLDFNAIHRRWFTRHGMHLRLPGKRILAKLMLDCLLKVSGQPISLVSSEYVPKTTSPNDPESCIVPKTPLTLPYDSFADAVKGPLSSGISPNAKNKITSLKESNNCFLEDCRSQAALAMY